MAQPTGGQQTIERVFLGTGLLGAAFAEASLERGERVVVWNRTRAKAEPLGALGARVCASPDEAVRGRSRIHVVLTNDAAVDAVLEAIRPALAEDALVIDHSTTGPAATAARAERLAGAGVSYVHAPVFMSPAAARASGGTMLAAGPAAALALLRDELSAMTGELIEAGPDPRRSAALKLLGNTVILSLVGGLADAFAVGGPHGVTPDDALELLQRLDLRFVLAGRGAQMAAGEFAPAWTLATALKDVQLMVGAAGERELAQLPGLAGRMHTLIDAGYAEQDVGVLAQEAFRGTTGTNA